MPVMQVFACGRGSRGCAGGIIASGHLALLLMIAPVLIGAQACR
jgi:hypothetical protein